jgi:hypothetical protein
MPAESSLGVDRDVAEKVRATRRELAARENTDLTVSEVLRRAVAALRQLAGLDGPVTRER